MKKKIVAVVTFLVISITSSNMYGVEAGNTVISIDEKYGAFCEKIGEQYGICPELLEAMIEQESAGQADAVSSGGDIGLMQVNPKWHRDRMDKLGITSLYDPYSNILVAADYLVELFEMYGDLPLVLMEYNGSSDAESRYVSGNYTEYAISIMERSENLERLHGK